MGQGERHATGNPEYIRKAFFPDAKVMAFRDGKLLNLSVEEFASRFSGKPARIHLRKIPEPLVMSRRYAARFKTTFG